MQAKQTKRNSDPDPVSTVAVELAISNCLLKKLAKNYDESEHYPEYNQRICNLHSNILALRQSLETPDAPDVRRNTDLLSSLVILFLELNSKGEWNTADCAKHKEELEEYLSKKYQISLISILQKGSAQDVFDQCLNKLNKKLTLNDFKKYPSMIEVYHDLLLGLKDYKVQITSQKVLVPALHLINDHIPENKIKGLACCDAVLTRWKNKDFENGNYYEVVFQSLINLTGDKSLEITKLVFSCLISMVKLLPLDVQKEKCETLYSTELSELCMESNFYRKKIMFESLQKIITLHGVNCVMNKKRFLELIMHNLYDCKVKEVKEVILYSTLQCLEEWIKYCWCAWCYQKDHKLLSVLFFVLYLLETKERKQIKLVQNTIITLIGLSLPDQQDEAIKLMSECSIQDPEYRQRVNFIETHLDLGEYRDKITTV